MSRQANKATHNHVILLGENLTSDHDYQFKYGRSNVGARSTTLTPAEHIVLSGILKRSEPPYCSNCGEELRPLEHTPDIPVHVGTDLRTCANQRDLATWPEKGSETFSHSCEKCGGEKVRVEHVKEAEFITAAGNGKSPSEFIRSYEYDFSWTWIAAKEHLLVICQSCGHQWRTNVKNG